MHMVSRKNLNKAEMSTVRMSKRPTARSKQEKRRRKNVKEFDLFVTIMLLEETPAVLSLGKLCEELWVFIPLDQRSKTTSHQQWQEN